MQNDIRAAPPVCILLHEWLAQSSGFMARHPNNVILTTQGRHGSSRDRSELNPIMSRLLGLQPNETLTRLFSSQLHSPMYDIWFCTLSDQPPVLLPSSQTRIQPSVRKLPTIDLSSPRFPMDWQTKNCIKGAYSVLQIMEYHCILFYVRE